MNRGWLRTSSASVHRWPTSRRILLAPHSTRDTGWAAGKKGLSEATRGPAVPREVMKTTVCARDSPCTSISFMSATTQSPSVPPCLPPGHCFAQAAPHPLRSLLFMVTLLPQGSSFPNRTSPARPSISEPTRILPESTRTIDREQRGRKVSVSVTDPALT
jgi:hypothetical protein